MKHAVIIAIVALLCIAPARYVEQPKGAFRLMQHAKASRLDVALPPLPPQEPATAIVQTNPVSVTLAWDPSPSSNVNGYMIYIGTAHKTYVDAIDVGNQLTGKVDNVSIRSNYFFAVTAYDSRLGLESVYSDEVKWPVTTAPLNTYAEFSLQFFEPTTNGWWTRGSFILTNPVGKHFYRWRGDATNRAQQEADSPLGPWRDIPGTVTPTTGKLPKARWLFRKWNN